MFTKEEKVFLLQLLDQVNVSGVAAKTMVIVIMEKLSHEKDTDIPDIDTDAS